MKETLKLESGQILINSGWQNKTKRNERRKWSKNQEKY